MPLRSTELIVLLRYPSLEAYISKTREISVPNGTGMNLLYVWKRLVVKVASSLFIPYAIGVVL